MDHAVAALAIFLHHRMDECLFSFGVLRSLHGFCCDMCTGPEVPSIVPRPPRERAGRVRRSRRCVESRRARAQVGELARDRQMKFGVFP